MFDMHIHSKFSLDGNADPAAICKKAIQCGLDGITFTDHLDYDYPGYSNECIIDFSSYMTTLHEIKQEFNGSLEIFRGIEAGIQPHVIAQTQEIISRFDFDYVLASVHIIDGIDPYAGVFYSNKEKKQAYAAYLEKVLAMLDGFQDFDMVGHLDFIIRHAPYDDRSLLYDDHRDLFDEIFKKLISEGKGFEVNTVSYRDKPGFHTALFDTGILERYKYLGGEILCLGSDAHDVQHIGYKFQAFSEMIKRAGFRYLTHFSDRKPVFTPF